MTDFQSFILGAFESMPLPTALTDATGRALLVNRAFREATGYSLEHLAPRALTEIFLLPNSEAPVAVSSFREGVVDLVDLKDERTAGYLSIATWTGDEDVVRGYTFVFRASHKEKESGDRLISARKLESLGSLAGGIAHDLNNILTGILGHVSFLRLSLPQEGSHLDSLVAIEDGARRAAAMTNQILGFAREGQIESRPVNLSLVVAAGVNLLRGALPKNIQLNVIQGESDIFVDGDESRLTQLFMNLAVNARDAVPNGGTINIRLERVQMPGGVPKVNLPGGTYAKLSIEDNGMGMPPDIKARIFEPFFTTKNNQGTGIGLATVASIVKAHGGGIYVQSEVGCGTCFEVFLAASAPEQAFETDEDEETAASELPLGNERVLVVDDEEVVRTVIQRSLEHLGYRVDVAKDGADAISRFRHDSKGYALVILDMMMPKMAGDEVFSRLKEIDSGVRVLLVSGYTSEGRAESVLGSGGFGFIQKPFSVEELAREVRRCLDTPVAAPRHKVLRSRSS